MAKKVNTTIVNIDTRKLWVGKANYAVSLVYQYTPEGAPTALVVGKKYLAFKGVSTDDFSNVGHGADESIPFIATAEYPAKWTNSVIHEVVEDVTLSSYYNTLGVTLTAQLKIIDFNPVILVTTSAPYWTADLAIYDLLRVNVLDSTTAIIAQANTKLVLELI
jgi:hypothetical protein